MIKIENRGKQLTVLIFSGLAPRNLIFEWFESLKNFPCNIVGIKDDYNSWYQRDNISMKFELSEILANVKKENIICLGGSAGGFAALWFGRQLNVKKIIAFSPQSACGKIKRDLGDLRWPEFCLDTPEYDIKSKYKNAVIFYAEDDELDVMHAERLDEANLVSFPSGGHDLARKLKAEDKLVSILQKEIL